MFCRAVVSNVFVKAFVATSAVPTCFRHNFLATELFVAVE